MRGDGATAYVGLGSNLGDRTAAIHRAAEAIDELVATELVSLSKLYETEPRIVEDQPAFVNACAEVRTRLRPAAFLEALLGVERRAGRDRDGARDRGPRPLDLDLLLYGDRQIDRDGLDVPHPGLAERAFVLVPLAEIAPDLEPPGVDATVSELRDRCDDDGWIRRASE
ncbi:MAG: 2-amino-4-hydroxy-6-hydroxymethyldihydropteridine diphosphokinase [Bradymonadaceae bacterium]